MTRERVCKYLTYEEAIYSQTAIARGIDNTPDEEQFENMQHVGTKVFDPCRVFVGGPLHASSFFRSKKLNAAIGGSSTTSQHMKGEAIDINCKTFGNGRNLSLFYFILENLNFDQLILEYPDIEGNPSWVHVSLKRNGKNRKEVLVKLKAKYIKFIDYAPGMV